MDVFDIIGPVMVGPSSSHTAGAVRIGRVARVILGEPVIEVDIVFRGSFAKTYKGHGTDRAVIGGLLGMGTDDPRIKNSLAIAQSQGMKFSFDTADLGDVHPNTTLIRAYGIDGKKIEVMGSSIGGGSIIIKKLNGLDVDFTGDLNTIIVFHKDAPGAVASVTNLLAGKRINIAQMKVFRSRRGGDAVMVIDVDDEPTKDVVDSISTLSSIKETVVISPV